MFKAFTKRMQLLEEYLRRTLKLDGNKEKGRTKERDDGRFNWTLRIYGSIVRRDMHEKTFVK